MSSVSEDHICPKCGSNEVAFEYVFKTEKSWMRCSRCGYFADDYVDEDKSEFADDLVWKHVEGGGIGSLSSCPKGETGCRVDTVSEESIDRLKKRLGKLRLARCSFKENGKWFIRDLLSDATTPYSFEELYERSG